VTHADVSVQVREIYPMSHATTHDAEGGGVLGMSAVEVELWLSSKVLCLYMRAMI
jgi:hypothetical protein